MVRCCDIGHVVNDDLPFVFRVRVVIQLQWRSAVLTLDKQWPFMGGIRKSFDRLLDAVCNVMLT